jgi:hypothetical protein
MLSALERGTGRQPSSEKLQNEGQVEFWALRSKVGHWGQVVLDAPPEARWGQVACLDPRGLPRLVGIHWGQVGCFDTDLAHQTGRPV